MNARFYVPGVGKFASADTIVPDPKNPQTFNRYSYVNNNPLNYTDPSGHDPLGAAWRTEFRDAYGRDPDARDEWIRLFSIAYPEEWDPDTFYNSDGSYREGSIENVSENPPASRSWNSFADAVDRLSQAYTTEETDFFVQDMGFLSAGMRARSQEGEEGTGTPYWQNGRYRGNSGVFLNPGTLPDELYTRPDGSIDGDYNVHHFVAFFVLSYHIGEIPAQTINHSRENWPDQRVECGGWFPGLECLDRSDILIGDWGASVGGDFRGSRSFTALITDLRAWPGGE